MGIIDFFKKRQQAKKFLKDTGFSDEEISSLQEDFRKGNKELGLQKIANKQEQSRDKIKVTSGIDVRNLVPEIGIHIYWEQIVNQVFRVLEFDKSDTTIEQNNKVKAQSLNRPYGYLIVESPILNQKARLPIIHQDDFLLAASVFDTPNLSHLVVDEELLVTYSPKVLLSNGFSGSPHHVLHYVITPRGTLDSYYSMNDDIHMAHPDPKKLFGPFVYEGLIKIQMNLKLKL